ncbi:MAG: hypothetical protein IKJ43_04560 [Bacilli bacterium]|nr:hypothetical protein [Bacilli bacterium]
MKEIIFRSKRKYEPNFFNIEDYKKIDETIKLIPLYFEPVFKKIFRNQKLLKKFLVIELGLEKNLEYKHAYYGESVLLNKYGPFVTKTSVILKLYKNKKPLIITFAQVDYNQNYKENKLYELVINYDNKMISNGKIKIVNKTKKDLIYFRKLYKNNIPINRQKLLMVALTSKSFKELYEIISKIYNKEDTYTIMKSALKASKNQTIKKEWKKYNFS